MEYTTLKQEILNGPLSAELMGLSDDATASILNEQRFAAIQERFITARTILAELGADVGAGILDKLEAASAQSSPLKWAMKFLLSDGIDIGHSSTRSQVEALQVAGVLMASEATALLGMASKPASRAEIAGFGIVTPGDVSRALRGPY